MQKQTKHIYSAYSGTFYEIPEADVNLLDMGQLPLLKTPSKSCKVCYGRGHKGRDQKSFQYIVCNCVKKVLDLEIIKKSLADKINLNNISLQ